jgi:formate-dependent phosphoribosylglycinamide formyltransferase (GAR transformylase)
MAVCILDNNVLLVLGAGTDQIPGLKKASEMGIYTIALDGNPHAEGFKYSSEQHIVNIKSMDDVESFIKSEIINKSKVVLLLWVSIFLLL